MSDERQYSPEEHEAINVVINLLGGYTVVFNALSEAVKEEANGKAISPMTFAHSIAMQLVHRKRK